MNILFIANLQNKTHLQNCEGLLRMFDSAGLRFTVYFPLRNKLNFIVKDKYPWTDDIDALAKDKYHLVIAFNIQSLNKAKTFVESNDLPLIYCLDARDIYTGYPGDYRSIAKIIVLNSPNALPSVLPKGMGHTLNLPVSIPQNVPEKRIIPQKPKVLIQIEESGCGVDPLLQITPFINSITWCEVMVALPSKTVPELFNPQVKILIRKGSDADSSAVSYADIVIGNGNYIKRAIGRGKPCIVVGHKGYGGIVNKANLGKQYNSGFSGRLGGTVGESIPIQLLFDDIMALKEWEAESLNQMLETNYNLLKQAQEKEKECLIDLLNRTVKTNKLLLGELKDIRLKVSDLYNLLPHANNACIIIQQATKKVHAQIEKEEFEILDKFQKGKKVSDVIAHSAYSKEPELLIDFLKELLKEQILVVDE